MSAIPLSIKLSNESLFNSDNKAIQSIIVHLTNAMNSLGEEKAQKLHNEPIKEHYLGMLFALITHAKVEKPNYKYDSFEKKGSVFGVLSSGVRQDKAREANLSSFLESFSVQEAKQEINISNINDQNYDKALALKTDSATLYEKLKKLDGISSYVAKFDGSAEQAKKSKLGGGEQENLELNKKLKILRNTTSYKTLLASSKALSFFMVAGNIADFTQGKKRINLTNLVSFAGDLVSASGTVVNIARDPVVKHVIAGARGLSRVTVPESLEHVAKLNKVVSASTMKVIARFGLIGPMVGAVNELSEINLENNKDYFIAVSAKNAIYLGLLFSTAWVAFGAVVLTEIVWYFLKDYIQNSKIELYLYDSLLFNTTAHNDNRYFNDIETSKSFRASIFLDTLKSSNETFQLKKQDIKPSELKGFSSSKETREFIADNYDKNSNLINVAIINELSQLKSVLYGYSILSEDGFNSTAVSFSEITINVHSKYNIKLSSSLYGEAKEVYVTYDKAQEDGVYKTVYEKLPKRKSYDITAHLISRSDEFKKYVQHSGLNEKSQREKEIWMTSSSQTDLVKEALKNVSFIAVCENVSVKYEIAYNIDFRMANNQANITEIKSSSLSEEDNKYIKENNA
jgi:hypothetical protein